MDKKVIQSHGSNIGATCAQCGYPADREELEIAI
jgi:NAD-dependent SIR2 family protein deacetylase